MSPDIPTPDAPPRQHKRSMQLLALAVVLALPAAFLAWGSFLLAPLGLGPGIPEGQTVSEDLDRVQAEARLAAEKAAADDARRERDAAIALPVPAYDPNRSFTVAPGQTVVSLSFDDGLAGAARMADILGEARMQGTFYVNSGLLDLPGYLTLRQAKEMADEGHDIGGPPLSHHLTGGRAQPGGPRAIFQERHEPPPSWSYPRDVP